MRNGTVLPRHRQPRRPRRVLAPGCRSGTRGETVRLGSTIECAGVDGAAGATGVEVRWLAREAGRAEPGDVVVEAFGCDPPALVRRAHGGAPRRRLGSTSNTSAPSLMSNAATACPAAAQRSRQVVLLSRLRRAPAACCASAICCAARGLRCAWPPRWDSLRPAGRARRESVLLRQPGGAGAAGQLSAQPTLLLATPGRAQARQSARRARRHAARGELRAIELAHLTQVSFRSTCCGPAT